jgi:hypothetical protein
MLRIERSGNSNLVTASKNDLKSKISAGFVRGDGDLHESGTHVTRHIILHGRFGLLSVEG